MLPGLAGSAGQKFTLVLQMEKWKPLGRLGPCPRSQQGHARLPGETTRKPSDTALFLTVLAAEMSSHRKRDPPPLRLLWLRRPCQALGTGPWLWHS